MEDAAKGTLGLYIEKAQAFLDTVSGDDIVTIIIVAVILFVCVLIPYLIKKEKKRVLAVHKAISLLGLTEVKNASDSIIKEMEAFQLFSSGRRKKADNVHRGSIDGGSATFMEYKYTTGSGKNSSTHRQTVLVLESDKLSMPAFSLAPEHFVHRIASKFGFQDIDFDAHEEFSAKYLLRGEDETAIRSFFNPTRVRYFESHHGLNLQGIDSRIVFYSPYSLVKHEEIRDFIAQGSEIIRALSN